MALKDIFHAEQVEIFVDQTGKIWINTEEGCVLRIGHANEIIIDDPIRDGGIQGREVVYSSDSKNT